MRANFVGSSVVSAITHTPASGPLGPVTTPPMSSLSMATSAAACWAYERVNRRDEDRAAMAARLTAKVSTRALVMVRSSDVRRRRCYHVGALTRPDTPPELLSIIVPVYNEVRTVRAVLDRLVSIELPLPREILVVDDGSTDGTGDLLTAAERDGLPVTVIRSERNGGKGS